MINGELLKTWRKVNYCTQQALADKLGVSQAYIGMIENGKFTPSVKMLIELADIMEITLDELLCRKVGA